MDDRGRTAKSRLMMGALVCVVILLAGYFVFVGTPWGRQLANFRDTARVVVTPNCNTYNISVTGRRLDQPKAFVKFSFTITNAIPPVTITGSIPVSPNQAGDFSASEILPLGQNFPNGGTLSGSATLFKGAEQSQTIPITFSISTRCPPTQ
jgi:hypothetical protein